MTELKKPEKSKKAILAELAENAPVFMRKSGERYAFFQTPENTFWGPTAAVHVSKDIDDAIKYLQGMK